MPEYLGNGRPLPHSVEHELLSGLRQANLLTGGVWQAIAIAKLAHSHQVRFDGTPYLEQHVYPIALELSQSGRAEEIEVVVALLHDVLEDCRTVGHDDLQQIFGEKIADAVDIFTKPWARDRDLEPDEDAYFAAS